MPGITTSILKEKRKKKEKRKEKRKKKKKKGISLISASEMWASPQCFCNMLHFTNILTDSEDRDGEGK